MGSFSATFECESETYTVLGGVQQAQQEGNPRGQPTSKAYSDELLLTLEVRGGMLALIQ